MKIRINIYDPYKSKYKIIKSLIGDDDGNLNYGQLNYSGDDTISTVCNNFYNFVSAMTVVDSYSFFEPYRITVIGDEKNTYIIDDKYNFSFTLYGSEGRYDSKKLADFWQKFLENHLDNLGEWKNEEIDIGRKLVRGDIGESEKEI